MAITLFFDFGGGSNSILVTALWCIVVCIYPLFCAFVILNGLRQGKETSFPDLLALFLSIITVIFAFAATYSYFGILHGGEITHNKVDSLYFSIVTWTTLGYGDFIPTPDMRIVAGIQALLGYISMALFLALFINFFKLTPNSKKEKMKLITIEESQNYILSIVGFWDEKSLLTGGHYEIFDKKTLRCIATCNTKEEATAELNRLVNLSNAIPKDD